MERLKILNLFKKRICSITNIDVSSVHIYPCYLDPDSPLYILIRQVSEDIRPFDTFTYERTLTVAVDIITSSQTSTEDTVRFSEVLATKIESAIEIDSRDSHAEDIAVDIRLASTEFDSEYESSLPRNKISLNYSVSYRTQRPRILNETAYFQQALFNISSTSGTADIQQ